MFTTIDRPNADVSGGPTKGVLASASYAPASGSQSRRARARRAGAEWALLTSLACLIILPWRKPQLNIRWCRPQPERQCKGLYPPWLRGEAPVVQRQ